MQLGGCRQHAVYYRTVASTPAIGAGCLCPSLGMRFLGSDRGGLTLPAAEFGWCFGVDGEYHDAVFAVDRRVYVAVL